MPKIYEIYGQDAHAMTIRLLQADQTARRIPKGGSVALKPNLVAASAPELGATTHPGVLSGCIEYLQSNGVQSISVIEGSWVGEETDRAFRECGYDAVCRRYGVPFYDLKKDRTQTVDTPLRPMEICRRALEADFLINLPVLKGHCQTVMTCALKNCKGCLPDREKRRFHSEGLIRPIAALGATLVPDLVIVDSICGDLDFEEGGTPVQTNRMYLGRDPVQIDAYGCRLMGLSLDQVPYIGLAEAWGAGSTRIDPEDVVALNAPQQSRDYPAPSGTVRRLSRAVHADSACSACYASLIRALYLFQKNGGRLPCELAIGQGWRGKAFDGLGVGACCGKMERSVPGCPPTAQEILGVLEELDRG